MISVQEIKERLNSRAEEVCRHLLPTGRRDRMEWCCGDIRGAAGQSLRIHLDGPKAGIWADFKDGDKGANLIDLWMAVKGQDFKTAIREVKQFLNIRDDGKAEFDRKNVRIVSGEWKEERKVVEVVDDGKWLADVVPLVEGGRVWRWLTEVRKIDAAVLVKYRVMQNAADDCVVFGYFWAGELVFGKYRSISEKKMWVKPAGVKQKLLYGIDSISGDNLQLVITEGELDALAMASYGIEAVSVPFGAGAAKTLDGLMDFHGVWIQECFDWMSVFDSVVLALDMDVPGEKATEAISRRIGLDKCCKVVFPTGKKDANECLLAGITEGEMKEAVRCARNFDPNELKRPSEFAKDIWDGYYPAGGVEPGDECPFAIPFRFREAEVTVWQGYTKHGKTVLMSYVMSQIAKKYGRKVLIASFEIPAARTLQNMGRQILGEAKPRNQDDFKRMLGWMDRHLFIFDFVGTADIDKLFEVIRYAVGKYGIKHVVIDSLMKLNVNEDDYESQKNLLNRLCEVAKETLVHIHIVAHAKKPDARHPEETHWPSKYSVSGSAAIVNLAHNVVCVWRNKKKEQEMEAALMLNGMEQEDAVKKLLNWEDALFIVQAQRGGNGEEPIKRLWFDQKGSWRYREDYNFEAFDRVSLLDEKVKVAHGI